MLLSDKPEMALRLVAIVVVARRSHRFRPIISDISLRGPLMPIFMLLSWKNIPLEIIASLLATDIRRVASSKSEINF